MEDMISYIEAAMERAMKVTEAILRAIARKVTWWEEAEIIPRIAWLSRRVGIMVPERCLVARRTRGLRHAQEGDRRHISRGFARSYHHRQSRT